SARCEQCHARNYHGELVHGPDLVCADNTGPTAAAGRRFQPRGRRWRSLRRWWAGSVPPTSGQAKGDQGVRQSFLRDLRVSAGGDHYELTSTGYIRDGLSVRAGGELGRPELLAARG